MPYIKQSEKDTLLLEVSRIPDNAGELNYIITDLIQNYYNIHGGRYQQINDVIGVLESAKLEFYRRIAIPYENQKISENGDVMLLDIKQKLGVKNG